MKLQEIAPGCAAHLKLVSEFYQAESRPSIFTTAYRELLAHRYNLLIPEDARVLEVGCGASDLLHRIRARDKIGVDLSPEQDCGPIVRKLAFFGGDPLKKRILPITLPGPSFSASPTITVFTLKRTCNRVKCRFSAHWWRVYQR